MSQGFSGSEAPPAPSVPAVTSLRFGMDTAIAGGGAEAGWSLNCPHNPEVAGSNPAPAIRKAPLRRGFFLVAGNRGVVLHAFLHAFGGLN